MVKTTRPEWLNTQLINTLRWEENDGKMIEMNHSTFDLKRKTNTMNKRVGLWLDRKKAIIVSITNNIEAKTIIASDMEHYALYSTVVPGDGSPENIRDRRFWNHLGEYYDKIIAQLRDAVEIQIFGPEEAKYELQKRLEGEGLAEYIISVEDAGTLTNLQIASKVRERFPVGSQFDIF
ncbi:MAG TPA: hypothetical protein VFY66_18885 [Anaerolineales bacterium]|nr:hypothetical protein [Anaerolineales bacterium]